jgi:hypothetical protein
MLDNKRPLVIDTMISSWNRSLPGAVGLSFRGHTYGTFDDAVQRRLVLKMRELTGGNMATDRGAEFQCIILQRLQSCATFAPRRFYECLLVSWWARGVGSRRQAGRNGSAGRLVVTALVRMNLMPPAVRHRGLGLQE